MAIYEVSVTHRFEIEADDIQEVENEYEFPNFDVPSVEWSEFIDSSFEYEVKAVN